MKFKEMPERQSWREIPDELWELVGSLFPAEKKEGTVGRPQVPNRKILNGILFKLITGCQWKRIPSEQFGSGSVCHARFQQWVQARIFEKIWGTCLKYYEELKGIDWKWQSVDSATVKSPKGGDLTGPNPTDRAKSGTKRHTLTDRKGIPLSVVISAANRHDMKMLKPTLDNIVVRRPNPTPARPQNLCLDKGYDYPEIRQAVKKKGYIGHIKERGTGNESCATGRKHPPRRWVVERTNGWHNKFRGLLIRWERKSANYHALVQFACAIICFRRAVA